MPDVQNNIADMDDVIAGATGLEISPDEQSEFQEGRPVATDFLDIVIDAGNMYVAPLPITNASEDRDGEITDPDGLIDVAYRTNPVVYLNHSHKFAPMLPPIGTCETPQRKYDLHRTETGWSGGTLFAQSHKLGSQTFAMVAEGLLRARSIGALNHELAPYKPKAAGQTFHEGRILPVRTKSVSHKLYEMVEFSWVGIGSNREMTIALKSLLSRDRIDGQRLDSGLKMVLKSLDLSEPTANTQKSGRLYTKHFDRIFEGEKPMPGRLVAVRFSTEEYSPSKAKDMLKQHDIFRETELQTEEVDGNLFLRSSQKAWTGKTTTGTDPRVPGVQLIFSKGGLFDKEPEEETEEAAAEPSGSEERAAVEEIIQEASGKVQVQEGEKEAPPADGAEDEKAVESVDEVAVVDEDEEEMSGPLGDRYLKTLSKKLAMVMDMADASTGDLEPEMMEKCGEIATGIREKIEEIKAYRDERYGADDMPKPDDEGEDKDKKEKAPLSKEDAEMQKSLQRDLFFGRRHALPSGFLKSIRSAREQLTSGRGAREAGKTLDMVLKGLTAPVRRPSPVQLSHDELYRAALEERVRRVLQDEHQARLREIL